MSNKRNNKKNGLNFHISPKTENQTDLFHSIINNRITIATGPAGTGKTFITCYHAIKSLLDGEISKIIVSRPAKEACHERLGYMPGTLEEKMAGYVQPVLYNFTKFTDQATMYDLMRSKDIEVVPLAFMRGRDFDRCFVIVDEAQNCNLDQFKMMLTRITDRSKMVICGDTEQADIPEEDMVIARVAEALEGLPSFGWARLDDKDIVRSEYISAILNRLGQLDARV